MQNIDQRLTAVRPSPRQLALQQMEFYAFAHFTVNTYTGLEWGKAMNYDLCINSASYGIKGSVDMILRMFKEEG